MWGNAAELYQIICDTYAWNNKSTLVNTAKQIISREGTDAIYDQRIDHMSESYQIRSFYKMKWHANGLSHA